jgi:hypothetical protein
MFTYCIKSTGFVNNLLALEIIINPCRNMKLKLTVITAVNATTKTQAIQEQKSLVVSFLALSLSQNQN